LIEAELLAATDDAVRSILFPLLGTGVGGGELGPTTRELLAAAVDHLVATPATRLDEIYFLASTRAELAALEEATAELRWLVPVVPAAR
jgi:O-acetyl-ADP-ribose deacetylase (regulator of RNase III)